MIYQFSVWEIGGDGRKCQILQEPACICLFGSKFTVRINSDIQAFLPFQCFIFFQNHIFFKVPTPCPNPSDIKYIRFRDSAFKSSTFITLQSSSYITCVQCTCQNQFLSVHNTIKSQNMEQYCPYQLVKWWVTSS